MTATAFDDETFAVASARARKAVKLVRACGPAHITAADLATSPDCRAKATTLARIHPPSPATWALAVALLEAQ